MSCSAWSFSGRSEPPLRVVRLGSRGRGGGAAGGRGAIAWVARLLAWVPPPRHRARRGPLPRSARRRPWGGLRGGLALAYGLALLLTWLLAGPALARSSPHATPGSGHATASAGKSAVGPDDERFRLRSIKPLSPTPGAAVKVRFRGPLEPGALRVTIEDQPAEILRVKRRSFVVRVPPELPPGPARLRIFLGEERVASRVIRIDELRTRKILRGVLGGLALFVLGLKTLAKGLRGYVSRPVRAALSRWTRTRLRSAGFGVLLGTFGQSVTSAAALVVGFVQSRLLTLRAVAPLLVGAQVGATSVVLLLSLRASRESLWVVFLGVLWLSLSRRRRHKSAGRIILGVGLLFYGLALLRDALAPLVGQPDLLPFYDAMVGTGAGPLLGRLGAGAALGLLLQGPGAASALVVGIGDTTGALPLRNALEILAATNLGACLATFLLVIPFGPRVRRIARLHALIGVAFAALCLLLIPAAETVADWILAGPVDAMRPGKKLLLPHLAGHVMTAFLTMQVTAALIMLPAVGALERLAGLGKVGRDAGEGAASPSADAGTTDRVRSEMANSLQADIASLEAVLSLVGTGERRLAGEVEEAVDRVRTEAREIIDRLRGVETDEDARRLRDATVALFNLQRAVESLRVMAERGIEKDHVARVPDALEHLRSLAAPLRALLEIAQRELDQGEAVDVEEARAREIEINAREWELRARVLQALADPEEDAPSQMWLSEMYTAFEAAGNAAYSLVEALAAPEEL